MSHLRLAAITLALLISSAARADLRTYDVDPQYRDELYNALRRILEPQGQPTNGRVQLLPSGQILVNADTPTLQQVEQVLQALRTKPAPAAPRVSLRYWAVLGSRAQNAADAPAGAPPPAVLNDALSELRRLHGDLTFRVIGTAAVATNSGQPGEIAGTAFSVEQTAYVLGDTLNAAISMKLTSGYGLPIGQTVEIGSLSLRTTLERGEFVVLGESQVLSSLQKYDGPVFFIVHWEE